MDSQAPVSFGTQGHLSATSYEAPPALRYSVADEPPSSVQAMHAVIFGQKSKEPRGETPEEHPPGKANYARRPNPGSGDPGTGSQRTIDSAAGRQEQVAERNRNFPRRKGSREGSAQKKASKQGTASMARGNAGALTPQMRAAAVMMTGALTGSETSGGFRLCVVSWCIA